jgi:hypothetical protein
MRRLVLAAVCGTLVLAACSDQTQSPTEPSAPPPAQNFGFNCGHSRYPLLAIAPLTQDQGIFPTKQLRAEALLRVGAIALLWDTCNDRLARKAALATITWIDGHATVNTAAKMAKREALKAAILNGFGGSTTQQNDFVSKLYVPNGGPQFFTTLGGRATLKLTDGAFNIPTLITVRRLPDDFRLFGFPADRQDSPFWDYDATNANSDNTEATHTVGAGTATMAFCYKSGEGEDGHVIYPPPGPRIGHNPVPVGTKFEFVEEVDPVPTDMQNQLTDCPPPPVILGPASAGGVSGFTNITWSSAGHYLANLARTLLLPTPLRAATVGQKGPIAGAPVSLSPFGLVLPDCPDQYGYYTIFCMDESQIQ